MINTRPSIRVLTLIRYQVQQLRQADTRVLQKNSSQLSQEDRKVVLAALKALRMPGSLTSDETSLLEGKNICVITAKLKDPSQLRKIPITNGISKVFNHFLIQLGQKPGYIQSATLITEINTATIDTGLNLEIEQMFEDEQSIQETITKLEELQQRHRTQPDETTGTEIVKNINQLRTLYEKVNRDPSPVEEIRIRRGMISIDIPEEFLCPITFQLMSAPVIKPGGATQAIERSALKKWLETNPTCPLTRNFLTMTQVQTDKILQDKILNWLRNHLA